MRQVMNPQMELGEVRIEAIDLDPKSRDDIPALLRGLQHLYAHEETRARLFALLESEVLPATVNPSVGRPGMELWRILVMAILKQGLGVDYDRLHELVNEHKTIRRFLGHGSISKDDHYELETVMRNVNLLSPQLLGQVAQLIVESGHRVSKKKPGERLRGRCDSFVVETDVHYPTDTNLLWDAVRCLIRVSARAARENDVGGWRQHRHLTLRVKNLFNRIRRARQAKANPERVKACLSICDTMVERARQTLLQLQEQPGTANEGELIQHYMAHAVRQMDQVERRLIHGEEIPHSEKLFSIFEEHTRWIAKGKAGRQVELGVPVCVLEDQFGFILHHRIQWQEADVDSAVPMIRETREKYPELSLCSFDRGFHSPQNRIRLDDLLEHNVLPRKGRRSKADIERESEGTFRKARKQHPAIESAINNLEHRGLDRVRARGADGFERMVALSIVAFNMHRLGLILRRQEWEKLQRLKRAA